MKSFAPLTCRLEPYRWVFTPYRRVASTPLLLSFRRLGSIAAMAEHLDSQESASRRLARNADASADLGLAQLKSFTRPRRPTARRIRAALDRLGIVADVAGSVPFLPAAAWSRLQHRDVHLPAERFAGAGAGVINTGSSRHALVGDTLIKGCGNNRLSTRSDRRHAWGGMHLHEGLLEYVYSHSVRGLLPEGAVDTHAVLLYRERRGRLPFLSSDGSTQVFTLRRLETGRVALLGRGFATERELAALRDHYRERLGARTARQALARVAYQHACLLFFGIGHASTTFDNITFTGELIDCEPLTFSSAGLKPTLYLSCLKPKGGRARAWKDHLLRGRVGTLSIASLVDHSLMEALHWINQAFGSRISEKRALAEFSRLFFELQGELTVTGRGLTKRTLSQLLDLRLPLRSPRHAKAGYLADFDRRWRTGRPVPISRLASRLNRGTWTLHAYPNPNPKAELSVQLEIHPQPFELRTDTLIGKFNARPWEDPRMLVQQSLRELQEGFRPGRQSAFSASSALNGRINRNARINPYRIAPSCRLRAAWVPKNKLFALLQREYAGGTKLRAVTLTVFSGSGISQTRVQPFTAARLQRALAPWKELIVFDLELESDLVSGPYRPIVDPLICR
jgi:hypothetical protein